MNVTPLIPSETTFSGEISDFSDKERLLKGSAKHFHFCREQKYDCNFSPYYFNVFVPDFGHCLLKFHSLFHFFVQP